MAKELVRTNYLTLALHLLSGALNISPNDPIVLNETGVIYLRLERLEEALTYFSQAVAVINATSQAEPSSSGCELVAEEIFSNYATVLRKSNRLEKALSWYMKCLALSPSDPNTHASIAFTLHLLKRFDKAISSYHRALSLQPTNTFCIEMLNKAMTDACSSYSNNSYNDNTCNESLNSFHEMKGIEDDDLNYTKIEGVDDDGAKLSFMLGETDTISFLQ
jgi:anaphase-promoting complex subunit 6